jgi:hypothetical protein
MGTRSGAITRAIVILGLLAPAVASSIVTAADESRYVSVTIRGKLTDPETGQAMAGAAVRFVSTAEEGRKHLAITDQEGQFFVSGLTYGDYAVEIETATGERIHGINAFPVSADAPIEVLLKISKRVRSTTSVENRPERFVAVIEAPERINWRRFWKEFATFFGVAAGVGAGAL